MSSLSLESISMQNIKNPSTQGIIEIVFNTEVIETNLKDFITLDPSYIGTLGDVTSTDGGKTWSGTITRTPDMNLFRNKVTLNYNGVVGEALYDVVEDINLESFSFNQIGNTIYDLSYDTLTTVTTGGSRTIAMSGDGTTIIEGWYRYKYNSSDITPIGKVIVYEYNGNTWVAKGQSFYGEGNDSNYNIGRGVAISNDGSIIAFGKNKGQSLGEVRIYEYDGTNWIQKGQFISGINAYDSLGQYVSLSGNGLKLCIGHGNNNSSVEFAKGGVQVYVFDGTNWVKEGNTIYGTNEHKTRNIILSNDGMTLAVHVDPDFVAGLTENVIVYGYDGTNWVKKGDDIIGFEHNITTYYRSNFGNTMSLSYDGNILAIGANGVDANYNVSNNYTGMVRTLIYDGVNWNPIGQDIFGNIFRGRLGTSVSLSSNGKRLAVTEYGYDINTQDTNEGRMLVYDYEETEWVLKGFESGDTTGNQLGSEIYISGDGTRVSIIPTGQMFYIKVYDIGLNIQRIIKDIKLTRGSINFPEFNSEFEVVYSTNNKSIEEVQGNLLIEPLNIATITNVGLDNYGFKLVGLINVNGAIESENNKLLYYEDEDISGEILFNISTEEKAISNICFEGNVKVKTDKGEKYIKNIKRGERINGKKIEEVTKTLSNERTIVKIKEGSLGKGVPKEDTIITKEHKIKYKGKMIEARKLVNGETIIFEKYEGETLYNILLKNEGEMEVNGMIVETLNPSNNIAKLYKLIRGHKEEEKMEIIKYYNEEKIIRKQL